MGPPDSAGGLGLVRVPAFRQWLEGACCLVLIGQLTRITRKFSAAMGV